MIKAKIGAILCLLSGLIAAVIYFWIDIKIAPSLVLLENIRFCRIYYPVLVALDLVLLMYLFLKAYVLTGATETRQGVFSRLVASRPLEAVLMEAYAALNIFLAIRLYEYVRMDIYVPMMLAKSIFFTVLYQVQAIFAFIKQKKWMLLISLCGIVVLAAAVYAGLNWFLRDNPLNDAPKYLNILINGILSNVGKSWPESNYWITAAAIVGVECILPVIRLVGLSLYNTKNKIR
ncbi:MAG: hypothetical protein IJU28_10930 [Clostridia bacterium]|nr:hypothetical protein [Clostridia bacterium]